MKKSVEALLCIGVCFYLFNCLAFGQEAVSVENEWKIKVVSVEKTRMLMNTSGGTRIGYIPNLFNADEFLVVTVIAENKTDNKAFIRTSKESTYVIDEQGKEFPVQGFLHENSYAAYGHSGTYQSGVTMMLVFPVTGESKSYKLKLSENAPIVDLPEASQK